MIVTIVNWIFDFEVPLLYKERRRNSEEDSNRSRIGRALKESEGDSNRSRIEERRRNLKRVPIAQELAGAPKEF
jgi:hypothetical protein